MVMPVAAFQHSHGDLEGYIPKFIRNVKEPCLTLLAVKIAVSFSDVPLPKIT